MHIRYIKLLVVMLSALFMVNASAQFMPPWVAMDQVMIQISQEQWVTSKTAKIVVDVNASLDKSGLVALRNTMMKKLQQIVPSNDWHIVRFDRTQNQSGLEQIQAQAEVRAPIDQLNQVRDVAKKISKAGETYSINEIDFTPSLSDIEATRETVRQQIYQRINNELQHLNQAYSQQRFTIHTINTNFVMSERRPLLGARAMVASAGAPGANANADFAVSQKVRIDANVVFAAINPQLLQHAGAENKSN